MSTANFTKELLQYRRPRHSDRIRHSAPQGFVAPDTIRPAILYDRKFYECRLRHFTRNNASRNVCAPHTFGSEGAGCPVDIRFAPTEAERRRAAVLMFKPASLCTIKNYSLTQHFTSSRVMVPERESGAPEAGRKKVSPRRMEAVPSPESIRPSPSMQMRTWKDVSSV